MGVLTHNSGVTIFVYGNITLLTGRYTAGSWASTVYFNGAGNLLSAGNLFGRLTCAQSVTLSDNLSFIADQQCALVSAGNALNVNGKTISGNSITNRLIIRSDTVGTPRTVTVAGGTFANCDFQDIAFNNGGADLDLSAITGGSGNCGGNSMSGGGTLTFTAPSTQTFATTSGSWSDIAKWTSRVPLPQDLARFQPMSAGQTIVIDMPRLPDTDFSGCGSTNLPSVAATTAGLTYAVYGSLNLNGVGAWSCSKTFTFAGRSNATLTSNGKQIINNGAAFLQIQMPGCNLSLNDAILTGDRLTLQNGNLVTNNYSVTAPNLFSTAGTNIVPGSSLFTLTGSGGAWSVAGTVTAGTSTILLSYTGATATIFAGDTNTYNDITIAPGSGVLTFSGAFTFRNMTMSSAGTRSIVMTKATTYTQTGDTFLSGAGADDAPIITPSLLNGGFESAGAGGADVFANWSETVAGASTITRDTSDKYAGDASCRFDVDGSTSYAGISQSNLTVGKIYRISIYAKATDAIPTIGIDGFDGVTKTAGLTNTWTLYTFIGVATGGIITIKRNSGASKSIWIDNITVTPLNSVAIQSSGAGEAFTLTKASGLIASNYLAIKDSIATGGAVWLAGYNSTNISGNTGWHFNSPASGAGSIAVTGAGVGKALCMAIGAGLVNFTGSAISNAKALCKAIGAGTVSFASTVTASLQASAIGAGIIEFTGAAITSAKALASGIGIGNIEFAGTGGAKAICKAIGAGTVRFLATVFPTVAVWDVSSLFKATERYVGQYFKASKRRK